jgi:uncharacterized protein involved in exopolysaccharide biosynthesis
MLNFPLDRQTEPEHDGGQISYVEFAMAALNRLRRHFVLLAIITALFLGIGLLIVAVRDPEYTASATLGAAPSPLNDLTSMTSQLSGSLGMGLTKRLGLGSRGGNTDLFDQYMELLKSNRLAKVLAQDPNVLRAIFSTKYDWQNHTWKNSHGLLASVKRLVKDRVFHYPINTVPGPDDVAEYLKKTLTVDAPLTSSFVTVTLVSESPEKAEWLLNTLLSDADAIIREDKSRDVLARIDYLTKELPLVEQTDQKQALSMILSDQQQSMMTIRADKRYASALVDPPRAPGTPTAPNIKIIIGLMLMLAVGCWGGLIKFLPDGHWLLRLKLRPPFPMFNGSRQKERSSGPPKSSLR